MSIHYTIDDDALRGDRFLDLVQRVWPGDYARPELMELIWEASPTSIFLGAQPGEEGSFERPGYETSLNAYQERKPRPRSEV